MLKNLRRLFIFTIILSCGFTMRADDDGILRTVVIDAGHGGKDPGTRGKISNEKDVVLDLALQVATKIKTEMPEVRVILTRNSDRFVELRDRSGIANRKKADLFISIHCNASPNSKVVHGTETFAMGLHKTEENLAVAKRENAVILQEKDYEKKYQGFNLNSPLAYIMLANRQNAYLASSLSFADGVEQQFKKHAKRSSRGVKQAGFLVLVQTAMPSILIEAGFLSNVEEEKYLNSEEGQEEIAESIFRAFQQYKKDVEANN